MGGTVANALGPFNREGGGSHAAGSSARAPSTSDQSQSGGRSRTTAALSSTA
jgi:hypothetical protein